MNIEFLTQFAAEAGHDAEKSAGLFEALGINWTLLVQQSLAFLVLVFILGKFVYPHLIKAIDSRKDAIEAGLKEAQEAQERLAEAEARVADMIKTARKEADQVVKRSQQEATALIAEAEAKAKQRADRLVADARTQLDADVQAARRALKAETVQLVAIATEKIIGEKLDATKDSVLIEKALKERG